MLYRYIVLTAVLVVNFCIIHGQNIDKTYASDSLRFYNSSDTIEVPIFDKINVSSVVGDTIMLDSLTLNKEKSFKETMNLIYKSQPFRMTCVGVPLIAVGFIVKSGDKRIQGMRTEYANQFNNSIDDYSQYLPGALLLGLKLGGVKGRSSWKRMIVSDVFSTVLMAGVVNGIKQTADVTRPDGSNTRSFPSGHTATAFMLATMLHKEYGGVSPWYSIAGYSIATYTGVSRILNNKHWLSDVLVGAGIGILSTELGYFLADLIFKDKGINTFAKYKEFDYDHKPSFLGVYLGINFAINSLNIDDNKVSLGTGANAGIEGAYFWSRNFGLGGRFSVSDYPVTVNDESHNKLLNMVSGGIGPFFSFPILPQLLLGAKLLVGYSNFAKCEFKSIKVGDRGSVNMGTGLSLSILPSKSFNVRFFADYNLCGSYISGSSNVMHYFTLGSVAAINF